MSTAPSGSGPQYTISSACYRTSRDLSHAHLGPYDRCQVCDGIVCPDCIGRHQTSGGVICVECSGLVRASRASTAQGPARRHTVSYMGRAWGVLQTGGRHLWGGVRGTLSWLARTWRQPFEDEVEDSGRAQRGLIDIFIWNIHDDTIFQAVLGVFALLAACVVAGLVYATIQDIPPTRVIVAVVAAATLWALVAGQLRFRFRRSLGKTSSQVFAFLLALFLAFAFGLWLLHQTFIDRLLEPFT